MVLQSFFDILRSIKGASNLKTRRNFDEVFTSRVVQSFSSAHDPIDAIESLAKSLDAGVQYVGGKKTAAFLKISGTPQAKSAMLWIRDNPRISAMICFLRKDEDYMDAINAIKIAEVDIKPDAVPSFAIPQYDIALAVTMLSPLAHGGDVKAGNATLFRRRQVVGEQGTTMDLPFYSGNAVRGLLRDLLADDFLDSLGLSTRKDTPSVNLWFFHALYAGGALESETKATKEINAELGKNGCLKTDGVRNFRDVIPSLSLLGSALGNKILSGKIQSGDLRPRCKEWGTGDKSASELFDWAFLTRRDQHEGRSEDDKHQGMIANTEVLKEGVVLQGGLDFSGHIQELELSALGRGLDLLQANGILGANSNRGFGKCQISVSNRPDPQPYMDYLKNSKEEILTYLETIGAIDARS